MTAAATLPGGRPGESAAAVAAAAACGAGVGVATRPGAAQGLAGAGERRPDWTMPAVQGGPKKGCEPRWEGRVRVQ